MAPRSLGDLAPIEFENFIFDLVRVTGMRNLTWRTPGADGGRDIEGQYIESDFSGSHIVQKWYIEAKRYQSSVDWPTVWNKIAYAQNAEAAFLLMATTSTFSPKCIDEIEKWNARDARPAVRVWPRHEIEFKIKQQPAIGAKYGLVSPADVLVPALGPLSLHLARTIMAAGEAFDVSYNPSIYIQFSSALAELLLVRSDDLTTKGRIVSRMPLSNEPWYQWLVVHAPPTQIDTPAARALACALYLISRASQVEISAPEDGSIMFRAIEPKRTNLDVGRDLIDTIALWGDFEATVHGASVVVRLRAENA